MIRVVVGIRAAGLRIVEGQLGRFPLPSRVRRLRLGQRLIEVGLLAPVNEAGGLRREKAKPNLPPVIGIPRRTVFFDEVLQGLYPLRRLDMTPSVCLVARFDGAWRVGGGLGQAAEPVDHNVQQLVEQAPRALVEGRAALSSCAVVDVGGESLPVEPGLSKGLAVLTDLLENAQGRLLRLCDRVLPSARSRKHALFPQSLSRSLPDPPPDAPLDPPRPQLSTLNKFPKQPESARHRDDNAQKPENERKNHAHIHKPMLAGARSRLPGIPLSER